MTWSLAGGLLASDIRSTGGGPAFCTGPCSYNFTNSVGPAGLPVAVTRDYAVLASFAFSGPTVDAAVVCAPCTSPRPVYTATWSQRADYDDGRHPVPFHRGPLP